jgi:hypothetical protein
VEELGHPQGDRGLRRAGAAGEAHVQRGSRRLDAESSPPPIDNQKVCDFPDAGLDRAQPHELPLEALENVVAVGGLPLGSDVTVASSGNRSAVAAHSPM